MLDPTDILARVRAFDNVRAVGAGRGIQRRVLVGQVGLDEQAQIFPVTQVGGTVGAHSPCPDRAFAVGVILVFAIPVVDAVVVIQRAAVGLDAATVGVAPDLAGIDGVTGRFRHDLSPVGGQRRVGHFRLGTVQFERTQGRVQRVGSFGRDGSARKLQDFTNGEAQRCGLVFCHRAHTGQEFVKRGAAFFIGKNLFQRAIQ